MDENSSGQRVRDMRSLAAAILTAALGLYLQVSDTSLRRFAHQRSTRYGIYVWGARASFWDVDVSSVEAESPPSLRGGRVGSQRLGDPERRGAD